MSFPPYTYAPAYLFGKLDRSQDKRVASATERERLMGFPTGYTKALFKKPPETPDEEFRQDTARKAALGNSFHCVTVGWLLDLWLWSIYVRTDALGSEAILERARALIRGTVYNDEGVKEVEPSLRWESLSEIEEEDALLQVDTRPGGRNGCGRREEFPKRRRSIRRSCWVFG